MGPSPERSGRAPRADSQPAAAASGGRPWFRRRSVHIAGAIVLAVVVVLGALWYWYESGFATTTDAVIDTHIVTVSPQVAGQARLVVRLQPLNPAYVHGIHSLTGALAARGAPPAAASHLALGALYQMVRRQADMMAFDDLFWALMIFTVLVLPTVFLLKHVPLEREQARAPHAATAQPAR